MPLPNDAVLPPIKLLEVKKLSKKIQLNIYNHKKNLNPILIEIIKSLKMS